MTDESIRVGVIGAGSMGIHHVRVYDQLPNVDLVGIVDANERRATEIATDLNTRVYSLTDLLDDVDAVTIAVPTPYHYETAKTCIEQGVHVLVEKPLAATQQEAKDLIQAASENDVRIQVGHIERFNPAITALDSILDSDEIVAIQAERLGPPPERKIQDNSIIDLMIHDADIILSLLNSEPTAISGFGSHENNYSSATVQFESGVVATLISSRLTQRKVRKLKITTEDRYILLDYIDQTIDIHRQSAPEFINDNSGIQYRHESIIERPQVENREPLKAELESFIQTVVNDTEPRVTAKDGLRALKLVHEIDEQTNHPSEDNDV